MRDTHESIVKRIEDIAHRFSNFVWSMPVNYFHVQIFK